MGMRGPKTKEIDWELVGRLASIFCTQDEIAYACKFSVDSLDNRAEAETGEKLSDYIKRHQAHGKASLRRSQFKAAVEKGNPTMLIWMGKQFLGQRDHEIMAVANQEDSKLTIVFGGKKDEEKKDG